MLILWRLGDRLLNLYSSAPDEIPVENRDSLKGLADSVPDISRPAGEGAKPASMKYA